MMSMKMLVRGLALTLLVAGMSQPAMAFSRTPEIDAGSMTSALLVLSGGILMMTDRLRRK
jgi:hypothetical protein